MYVNSSGMKDMECTERYLVYCTQENTIYLSLHVILTRNMLLTAGEL